MNIQRKKVAVRAAAAALLLSGSSIVACTTTEDPMTTPGPQAGSPAAPNGGSAGMTAAGGASGGSSAMGAACMMPTDCPKGQVCTMMKCGCPAYAPNYCDADLKCTSPMKDPDHCGSCTTKCGPTQACSAGACTADLLPVGEVAGCGSLKLVMGAGGKILALSTMTGDLSSLPVAGGAAMPVATGLTMASAFAVDATNAYVAMGKTLTKVPLAGGATSVVVAETLKDIFDVAVDAGKLYYATGTEVKVIDAAAAAGTPAATAVALAIDEGEPQGVAIAGSILLYGSNSAMNVERCDTTMECHMDMVTPGAGHFKIGASQGGLIFGHRSVQTDGSKVYWVNNGLQAAPIMPDSSGGYPAKGIATPKDGGGITAFAIKGTTSYFAEQTPGAMPTDPPIVNFEKSAFDATDPTWIARGLAPVSSIVLDDTSAYLASGCKVLKSPL